MVDDDARDERLAAWLEPEPLDDVTRRRLVSTAMRRSRDSHALRWIASAAAIVVVLVGVLALVTAQGGKDEHEASAPARTPASVSDNSLPSAQGGVSAVPGAAAPESSSTLAAGAVDLGDFGDLDRAANLARLRSALDESGTDFANSEAKGTSAAAAGALAALPCRNRLPAGTILAVATGMLDGRRAVVVIINQGDGTRAIDAVLTDPCEVRPLS
jgi:hypothetical protein